MAELDMMTDREQLKAMLEKQANESSRNKIDENALLEHLRSRVKGQDALIDDVARLLRLRAARRTGDRPIANLLFPGPTGAGKTELDLTIAEYLYQDERALVAGQQVSRSGVRELDRVIFDIFAPEPTEAEEDGVKEVTIDAGADGAPRIARGTPKG